MPDLSFQITDADVCAHSITPQLNFKLHVTNSPAEETIHSVLLSAQIQIQAPQRGYNASEKEKLVELFGPPESWGQTLRNRLWTHTSATIGAFMGSAETMLAVPCTCDLNLAASKYLRALEGGDVSLLFLFNGSVFYGSETGRLQVSPISWNAECAHRMPVKLWRQAIERHYPNAEWLSLRRDTFEHLDAYKRQVGLLTWEEVIERLLEVNLQDLRRKELAAGREEISA